MKTSVLSFVSILFFIHTSFQLATEALNIDETRSTVPIHLIRTAQASVPPDMPAEIRAVLLNLPKDQQARLYGAYRAGFTQFKVVGSEYVMVRRNPSAAQSSADISSFEFILSLAKPRSLPDGQNYKSMVLQAQLACSKDAMTVTRQEYKDESFGTGKTVRTLKRKEDSTAEARPIKSDQLKDFFKVSVCGATNNAYASVGQRSPGATQSLKLSINHSQPDINGIVTFDISASTDTTSLKVNSDEEGGRADGRYSFRRFAQVGENRFEVVATDRYGNIERQTVVINREFGTASSKSDPVLNPLAVREVKRRDAVAIVIGIEKYRRAPTADFSNRDASLFVDYARRGLGIQSENIRLLLDEKADAAEILLAFKNWLPTRVNKGKTEVYVFYSGHGLPSEDGGSLYLLPHEANRDLLERTAIAQREIVEAIHRTSPKSVTMFIDSCYSGQSRTGETLVASARPIAVTAKQTSNFPSNFTVISASAPDQISSSSPDLKHGIFSYYLMRGMEGEADGNKDGQITVGEMQAYLSDHVPRRAMGMNRIQQPQVVGDQSRILLGRY